MSFWNKIEKPGFDAPTAPAASGPAEPVRTEPILAPPSAAVERAAPAAPPARTEPARTEPARTEPARSEAAPTVADLRLGRGVRLEGKLTFSGTVRIDATFQGSILTDGVLVVGEQAKVEAPRFVRWLEAEARVEQGAQSLVSFRDGFA